MAVETEGSRKRSEKDDKREGRKWCENISKETERNKKKDKENIRGEVGRWQKRDEWNRKRGKRIAKEGEGSRERSEKGGEILKN